MIKSECLAEVKLTYQSKVKPSERPQVKRSEDAYNVLKTIYDADSLEHFESAYLLLLNRNCKVIGWYKLSSGSTTGTMIDIKMIMQAAILANATNIILSHNHPSGNLTPSTADVQLTNQVKKACGIMQMQLIDHIIITAESYHSMADNGEI